MSQTMQLIYPESGFSPIDLSQFWREVDEAEFVEFCGRNPDMRIEMTKDGDIILMPPTNSETGRKNFDLCADFAIWARKDKTGVAFDSSTGFTLPNNARRSPDLSWTTKEKWNALSNEEKRKFARLVPDFVVELRSETDRLKDLQAKMEEYVESGVSLGWLIDPFERRIHVYRSQTAVEILENPSQISGAPLLKNFVLELKNIFD